MSEPAARYAVHPQAAWRLVGGEVFVVTDDRAFHRLEVPTAVDLFRAIARGDATREDLIASLLAGYEVTPEQAEHDVDAFLKTLLARRIIVSRQTDPPGP